MLLVRARLELHKSSVIVRLAMYDDPRAFFLSFFVVFPPQELPPVVGFIFSLPHHAATQLTLDGPEDYDSEINCIYLHASIFEDDFLKCLKMSKFIDRRMK